MNSRQRQEEQWARQIVEWYRSPVRMVRELFGAEPDAWQEEALGVFPSRNRIALPCAKGPGKTCVLAWMIWNFMLTRPNPNIAAVSITGDNLRDGLWKELAKWQAKSELLQSMFVWTKERIFAKERPEIWWVSARSWSQNADAQQQSDSLAGLHADYMLFVLDESGGIPDAVMSSAEAVLASGKECKVVQAGNTTRRSGPLWRACTAERNLWYIVKINGDPDNPKRSPRIDIDYARQQIAKARLGRNDPWVKVNILGEFPDADINALISLEEVEAAQARCYHEADVQMQPRVLGIDVAREGNDESVMFPRQGLIAYPPVSWRNINGIQGAGAVARKIQDWDVDATFIDDTGGFGAAWIDCLRLLGHSPIGVIFSAVPYDRQYYNKRAEMYMTGVKWIKDGGQLPICPELVTALTQTTYTHRNDRLIIEDKTQLKDRLGFSPDHADAFVETFAEAVTRKQRLPRNLRARHEREREWNPIEAMMERDRW